MRKFKESAIFKTVARCALSPENGKTLALASLSDLKFSLPSDSGSYPDLLPIAGNACVANLANGNGDMIDTQVALSIFPKFVHKYINIEHDRGDIVGHLTTANLAKFNANYAVGAGSEVLAASDITDKFEPFNISVGGYIYAAVFEDIAEKLIQANDPNHPAYLSIAFSWELGFDDYQLIAGSKERGSGEIIDDPEQIIAFSSHLKSKKGSGKLPDGREVYRLVRFAKLENSEEVDFDSVLPLGVGLTMAPAAAVAGVVTPKLEEKSEISANSEKNISLNQVINVTDNIIPSMKTLKNLSDVKQLNDETVKETSLANISNIIDAGIADNLAVEIEKKVKEYSAQIETEKTARAASDQKAADALTKVTDLTASLEKATNDIKALKDAQGQAEAAQKFSARMAGFDEKFELTDTDRKAIASRIKGLSDDEFATVSVNEIEVLLSSKKKTEAQASATAETVTETALANAQKTEQETVPNTPTATGKTLVERYAGIFGEGKIKFSAKR